MAYDSIGSVAFRAAAHSASRGVGPAAARHAGALEGVQDALAAPSHEPARDTVTLSDAAADHLARLSEAAPVAEQAVVDSIATGHAVEAAAATVRAEDERRAALAFVIAHHAAL